VKIGVNTKVTKEKSRSRSGIRKGLALFVSLELAL